MARRGSITLDADVAAPAIVAAVAAASGSAARRRATVAPCEWASRVLTLL